MGKLFLQRRVLESGAASRSQEGSGWWLIRYRKQKKIRQIWSRLLYKFEQLSVIAVRDHDEGQTLESSALESLYGGEITLSPRLISQTFISLQSGCLWKKNKIRLLTSSDR